MVGIGVDGTGLAIGFVLSDFVKSGRGAMAGADPPDAGDTGDAAAAAAAAGRGLATGDDTEGAPSDAAAPPPLSSSSSSSSAPINLVATGSLPGAGGPPACS